MNIGATIVNLRREKGVTQEQLARAVGVSKTNCGIKKREGINPGSAGSLYRCL